MTRNRLLGFSLLFFLVFFFSQPAWPCSCEPPSPPVVTLDQADVVFAGRVVSKEIREIEPYWLIDFVTFEVSSSWKGVVEEKITVTTNSDSLGSFCGFPFEEGHDYLVYGYNVKEEDRIFTGLCARTKRLEEAQDEIAELNRVTAIEPSVWGRIKSLVRSLISS